MIARSWKGPKNDFLALDFTTVQPNDSIVVVLNNLKLDADQERLKGIFLKKAPAIKFEFFLDTDIEDKLLDKYSENLHWYHEKILAGLELNFAGNTRTQVLFPGNYYHSSVRTCNLLTNVLLEWNTGDPNTTIVSWIKPILAESETKEVERTHANIYENLMALALCCYILFYPTVLFNDKSFQFKNMFCLSARTYWIASFSFDIIIHLLVIFVLTWLSILLDFVELFDRSTHGELKDWEKVE